MNLVAIIVQIFTGVQARWAGCAPEPVQRVYFANHTSHFDFLVLWSVLPDEMRRATTAAAASDYWTKNKVRMWLANNVFKVVLIDRENVSRKNNPISQLVAVLDQGKSLIIFPEGGRSLDVQLHEFKGGIYHLAKMCPNVDFIPAYIDNCNRVLPKGEFLPVPLICSVTFGPPMHLRPGERKDDFLARARESLKECGHP